MRKSLCHCWLSALLTASLHQHAKRVTRLNTTHHLPAFSMVNHRAFKAAMHVQIVLEGDKGWLWGLGVCFFGAPVACVYLIRKAYQGPIEFVQGASEGQKYC